MRGWLVLLLGLVAMPVCAGEARWYQVDLIVFERLSGGAGDEHWPLTPGYPEVERTVEPPSPGEDDPRLGGDAPPAAGTGGDGEELLPVPKEKLSLGAAWRRLRGSADYRPLRYVAWRQPRLKGSEAPRVRIRFPVEQEEPGQRQVIDGVVTLLPGFYLHADVDLVYFLPVSAENGAQLVRLKEKRRLRFDELHYLDHPLFGVLLRVTDVSEELSAVGDQPVEIGDQ